MAARYHKITWNIVIDRNTSDLFVCSLNRIRQYFYVDLLNTYGPQSPTQLCE